MTDAITRPSERNVEEFLAAVAAVAAHNSLAGGLLVSTLINHAGFHQLLGLICRVTKFLEDLLFEFLILGHKALLYGFLLRVSSLAGILRGRPGAV